MKRWKINKPNSEVVGTILKKTDLSKLCAEIMSSRGFSEIEQLSDFFNSTELADPFELIDMDKAVSCISNTIDEFKLICVYGDYDCDGVTATVVLYNYLECSGASVMYYIPERDDGYGLNKKAIDFLAEQGVQLIVTVDNGISAIDEGEYIYEKGMKLLITDHHQPKDILPKAEAIIDPHRVDCPSEFKNLAGVGVALKLCAALDDGNYEMVLEQYAELVAIGTVADIVPIVSENRTIVSSGLELMRNSENQGIHSLLESCSINVDKINSTSISFGIAPRINAAGRFGSPLIAVRALLSEGEEAINEVENLVELNNQRKITEKEIFESIKQYISENANELNQRVMVLCGKGWHHGVIGIVSSKVLDLYGKPNIILSIDDDGIARGSARSIKGFNLHKCLMYCSDVLEKFGGHECAGGMSLKEENIPEFCRLVQEYAFNTAVDMPISTITADKLLRSEDLTINSIESLSLLEPFGEQNPKPIFAILAAKLIRIYSLSQGKHTKLEFEYDKTKFSALLFGVKPEEFEYSIGEFLDLLVNVDINLYNNSKSVSIRIIDYRLHGIKQEQYFAAKSCYERFMLDEELPIAFLLKIVPQRQELVELYKYVNAVKKINIDTLYMRLANKYNYCKMRLCIDIFCEVNLLEYNVSTFEVTVSKITERKELSDSKLYRRLKKLVSKE